MTGIDGFQKYLRPCALDEGSFSIGGVKRFDLMCTLGNIRDVFQILNVCTVMCIP